MKDSSLSSSSSSLVISHNDEATSNFCLVDLHGTCIPLPFHREGLPYVALMLVSLGLAAKLLHRMGARELNAPNPQTSLSEWHLLLGRLGLLFFIVSTTLDHFRVWLGTFDESWPSYIQSAPNVTVAEDRWAHHIQQGGLNTGASVQIFLWWYWCFLVVLLSPLTLYSMTHIYWNARQRRFGGRHYQQVQQTDQQEAQPYLYFWYTTIGSTVLLVVGLTAFIVGPLLSAPLQVVQITGIWSLTTASPVSPFLLHCGTVAWQTSLLGLATALWRVEGPSKRNVNSLMVLMNGVAFITMMMNFFVTDISYYYWPIGCKWVQQLALASQLWADFIHNPDDYGRLADDYYSPPSPNSNEASLREPLLSLLPQQVDDEHHEQDDQVVVDDDDDRQETTLSQLVLPQQQQQQQQQQDDDNDDVENNGATSEIDESQQEVESSDDNSDDNSDSSSFPYNGERDDDDDDDDDDNV